MNGELILAMVMEQADETTLELARIVGKVESGKKLSSRNAYGTSIPYFKGHRRYDGRV